MAKRESSLGDKVAVDMTPMIDVVFQLMSFFMCSLKVVAPEGDFDIRMPLGVAAADLHVPQLQVRDEHAVVEQRGPGPGPQRDQEHGPVLPDTRAEMAYPLRLGGEVIGVLDLQSTTANVFEAEDLQSYRLLSDQIAIAIIINVSK